MATRRVKVLKPADEALNIYKVVSLASPDRGDVLAVRRGGAALPSCLSPGVAWRAWDRDCALPVWISSMLPRWA